MTRDQHASAVRQQPRKTPAPDRATQPAQGMRGATGMADYVLFLQRTVGNQATN